MADAACQAALAWEALLTHWRPHGSDRLLFTAGTCFILEVTFLSGCVVFWLLDALAAAFAPPLAPPLALPWHASALSPCSASPLSPSRKKASSARGSR